MKVIELQWVWCAVREGESEASATGYGPKFWGPFQWCALGFTVRNPWPGWSLLCWSIEPAAGT